MEGTAMNWRKASYSNGGATNCVEVASSTRNVMIRDTKQAPLGPGRTVLSVSADAWRAFAESMR